ncbi:hypothetical protein KSF_004340 [Reticulibacter mediterranei]|uniref:Beta-lactamase-related domain-containing protein n=1 Tax=Reticulibacter mediterranei TaxID=2778369 RepID=A0A8J3I9H4_9CHLR|nr:serine hydrolase [Reticulibacter mediterranei]GHO90386.1 hypothetical protein KSF_004340 [Reticulibacter mediterranei]
MKTGGLSRERLDRLRTSMTGYVERGEVPGRYGWDGGLGTSWFCDPKEDLIGIVLTQSLYPLDLFRDFGTLAYQAIDD